MQDLSVIKLKRKGNEFQCEERGRMEGTAQVAEVQWEAFQFKVINMNLPQAGSDQKPKLSETASPSNDRDWKQENRKA